MTLAVLGAVARCRVKAETAPCRTWRRSPPSPPLSTFLSAGVHVEVSPWSIGLGAVASTALGVTLSVEVSASLSRLAVSPSRTALVVDVSGDDGVAGRPPRRLTSLPLVFCAGRGASRPACRRVVCVPAGGGGAVPPPRRGLWPTGGGHSGGAGRRVVPADAGARRPRRGGGRAAAGLCAPGGLRALRVGGGASWGGGECGVDGGRGAVGSAAGYQGVRRGGGWEGSVRWVSRRPFWRSAAVGGV